MKKLLAWLVWLPLVFAVAVFLAANRQSVAVSLDPISTTDPAIATPALPLWIWLVLSLLIGFFAGAGGMWLSGRESRQKARAEHRELKLLKRQLADAAGNKDADTLPTLKAS